jgi:hypothetical protein
MAIELAVALTAIATKTIVAQLIQGAPPSQGGWGDVAGQVAQTLVNSAARQESGIQRLGQQVNQLSRQVNQLSRQVNEIPIREFGQHMAAGCRYLRDLPPAWRTDQDRRDLIHDARQEFVTAGAIAKQSNDLRRQALAEVAIAGCWLWVPSIGDVRNAAGLARRLLEVEVLHGAYSPPDEFASVRTLPSAGAASPVDDYIDVVKFCKAYGELSEYAALPLRSSPEARLAVRAVLDRWVECTDIWVHVAREQQPESATSPAATAEPAATPTYQSTLARLLAQQQAAEEPRLLGAYRRGQRGFGTDPGALPSPSHPPAVLKVTVSNKRAHRVSVSVSPTAARVSPNVAPRQSWSLLAPGETKVWRITVPSAARLLPGSSGLAFRGNRGPLGPGLEDMGAVAFLYPAQP